MKWVLATILTIALITTGMMLSDFINAKEENNDDYEEEAKKLAERKSLEEASKRLDELNKAHDELFGIRRDKDGKIK